MAAPAESARGARGMRPLPMAATGQPAPFQLGAPAYLVALGGWLAATVLLTRSAAELARLFFAADGLVAAAHAVGLVFFPFAVAAAVWQLLPVMLRNDPPLPGLRWLALPLLGAGIPLAVALASGRTRLAWAQCSSQPEWRSSSSRSPPSSGARPQGDSWS